LEIMTAWLVGTVAASAMYLQAWEELADLPMMVFDGLFWFGLLIFPLLLIAWPLLTLLRSTLRPNIPSLVVCGAGFVIAVFGLTRPETADPYSQPIYRILGATGLVWVFWVAATVFFLPRRRRDA